MRLSHTVALSALLFSATANATLDTRIIGGMNHTLYRDVDNNVIAVGDPVYGNTGQYAPPRTDTYYGMAPIHVGIKATNIAANVLRSAAIRPSGDVVWWGRAANGTVFSVPQTTPITNAVDVALTADRMYAILNTGQLVEWDFVATAATPISSINNAVEIDAGTGHVIVRLTNGDAVTFGSNNAGQLCSGDFIDSNVPVLIATGVSGIAAGDETTFVVYADGAVAGCGNNTYGRVGIGDPNAPNVNTLTAIPLQNVKQVTAGYNQTLAVTNDGQVYAWGWHNYTGGSCGVNFDYAPCAIPEGVNVSYVGAGGDHHFYIDVTNQIYGWGGNYSGKLGDGTNTERHSPTLMLPATGTENIEIIVAQPNVTSVAPGGSYIISGENFGATTGTVNVNGTQMVVLSWSDTSIHIDNPTAPLSGYLTVTTTDGIESNPVWVDLEPAAPADTVIDQPVVVDESTQQDEESDIDNEQSDSDRESNDDSNPNDEEDDQCKPGYGYGDRNHCHSGPPGLDRDHHEVDTHKREKHAERKHKKHGDHKSREHERKKKHKKYKKYKKHEKSEHDNKKHASKKKRSRTDHSKVRSLNSSSGAQYCKVEFKNSKYSKHEKKEHKKSKHH